MLYLVEVKFILGGNHMKTVLITGVSGFIGRELCGSLLQKGYNVIGTDKIISQYVGNPGFSFIQCDIIDKGKLTSIIDGSKIDALVHLACSVDNDFPSVIGDKELSDCKAVDKYIYKSAVAAGIKDILMLSTVLIFATPKSREPIRETADERPTTNYAKMKAESEKAFLSAIRKSATNGVVMRAAPVYSKEYIQNLHDRIYDYKDEVAYLYREGEYFFSFCCLYNILDFISGILKQDGSIQYQGVYNVCDTKPISAREIVEFEREHHHLGAVIQKNYSAESVKAALSLAGKSLKTDYRFVDPSTITSGYCFDNTKAKRISTFRWKLSNTK